MVLEAYRVEFKPTGKYWFTWYLLKAIEGKTGCFTATLDMGLTRREVCISGGSLVVESFELRLSDVAPSEEDRVVVVEENGSAYEVLRHTEEGFYKLKAIDLDKAPTLEINGIHMHRISGVNPWTDTMLKLKAARIRRGLVVLDTCMGLGYTAIGSVLRGASTVYTFEVDKNVVWIAERNPWSKMLASKAVSMFLGDVTELVYKLPSEYFHRVIHDPPRFTKSTGNLYSLEFYSELYRVLKPGGVLFHYTGEPRIHGPSLLKGIKNRLEKSGFKVLFYDEKARGFVALKPLS